jgi:hypothetical protein
VLRLDLLYTFLEQCYVRAYCTCFLNSATLCIGIAGKDLELGIPGLFENIIMISEEP